MYSTLIWYSNVILVFAWYQEVLLETFKMLTNVKYMYCIIEISLQCDFEHFLDWRLSDGFDGVLEELSESDSSEGRNE